MPIRIKPQVRKNPLSKEVKWYVGIDRQIPMRKEMFLDGVEKRSTLSSADCKGALDAIEYELKQALLNGNTVRLGDLGSFSLTVTSEAADTKANVSAANIKRVRVKFYPSVSLMRDMQPVSKRGKATFVDVTKQQD